MTLKRAVLFRRAIVFGAPLVLGLVGLGHPALLPGDDIVATLTPIATWWTALHVLQVPLFALLGVAVLLLLGERDGKVAAIARAAIAIFIVVYPAFDAAVGIASGVICSAAGKDAGVTLEPWLQALFWGPVTGLMAIVGSAAWLVAVAAAAWALRQAGAPWRAVGPLILAGVLLAIGHIRPLGPLACLFFLAGAAQIELASARSVAAHAR